jgi:hypothetical protein
MKTQSVDTSPDAERVLIAMIRQAPITKRFAFVQSWSRSMIEAGRLDVRGFYPQATMQEMCLLYLERQYGKGLVNELRTALQQRAVEVTPFRNLDFQMALIPLIEIFDQLDITYALGGSLASSLYGMQRATIQLDLIAALDPHHYKSLREHYMPKYYFHENEVKDALDQRTSFTLIHLKSLLKVVVTLPETLPTGREVFEQMRHISLTEEGRAIAVLAPEQAILLLLDAFKQSNSRADDLWYDLLAMVKVQSTDLDIPFLERRATMLDLTSHLQHALIDAGL